MAERNQKISDRVRLELGKNDTLGSRQLYEIAKKVDESIGKDTLQQFHARYVLPIRREESRRAGGGAAARTSRRGGRRKKAAEAAKPQRAKRTSKAVVSIEALMQNRQRARTILLQFAQEFATAETKPEIIEVMGRLDNYVDQIVAGQS